MTSPQDWVSSLNAYGSKSEPCFFLIDFEMKNVIVRPMHSLGDLSFEFNGVNGGNYIPSEISRKVLLNKYPIDYKNYLGQFMTVQQHIKYGNSFLINLTHKTPIDLNMSLKEIYACTNARYKLLFEDQFVMFSPESFIQIENNIVSTYPMKGTIDAEIENARELIMADVKEAAEHYTIVDLLRNDLSRIAKKVEVVQFRYIDEIITEKGKLLQVSSKISGVLPEDWQKSMGDILLKMLPAGSISGAPKDKTIAIIEEVEVIPRNYYTGIAGIFDGKNLDCGVCIRFIEQEQNALFFRSGCGITSMSDPLLEYNEMINKIYVPVG